MGGMGGMGAGPSGSNNMWWVTAAVVGLVLVISAAIAVPILSASSSASSSNSNGSNSSSNSNGSGRSSASNNSVSSCSGTVCLPSISASLPPVSADEPMIINYPQRSPPTVIDVYNVPLEEDVPYWQRPHNTVIGVVPSVAVGRSPWDPPFDPVARLPTPQPRDEPRWPSGPYPAEMGLYGFGEYGRGGYAPDGRYYEPGQLAGLRASAFAGYDGPTAAIMRRPTDPVGPWERSGALVSDDGSRVLPLFVRQRGRESFGKFNWRTIMGEVPLDVGCGTRSDWLNSGDWTTIKGLPGSFSVQLYEEFR